MGGLNHGLCSVYVTVNVWYMNFATKIQGKKQIFAFSCYISSIFCVLSFSAWKKKLSLKVIRREKNLEDGVSFLKVEMRTPTADVSEWLVKNLLIHRHGIISTHIYIHLTVAGKIMLRSILYSVWLSDLLMKSWRKVLCCFPDQKTS